MIDQMNFSLMEHEATGGLTETSLEAIVFENALVEGKPQRKNITPETCTGNSGWEEKSV